jgi:hypothetical protein
MSAITDQDFRQRVQFALSADRAMYGTPRYCLSRLVSAVSHLLTASSPADAIGFAAEIAALAQRAAVEGDVQLKSRPGSPPPMAGKRGGEQ